MKTNQQHKAFTLVELLVAVAIIGILGAISLTGVQGVFERSNNARCVATMRSLGQAMHLYSVENNGRFPRSFHSSGAHREPGWAASIAPYLGAPTATNPQEWELVFNEYFRSPLDDNRDTAIYSYAMNVFFELDPAGDQYFGSPRVWRRMSQIPDPGQTILLGQPRAAPFADHFMCHQWTNARAAENALAKPAKDGKLNFLFVDGHIERLRPEDTIDPSASLNLWNPAIGMR
jgi:prepilin-type N-terminal cleavage/methylation domain-containing protein/prepilin-type processing-associated H-X9-DG protein